MIPAVVSDFLSGKGDLFEMTVHTNGILQIASVVTSEYPYR